VTSPVPIPPADVQLELLTRGLADLPEPDELRARLDESWRTQTPLVVKAGFDPTAPDLHLGHTVLLEKMAQFQRLGHDVVFLVGDYTALIGDPTGRNALRPPLSEEQIRDNARTYTEQCFQVLDRQRTRLEWNSRWLGQLTYADLIRLTSGTLAPWWSTTPRQARPFRGGSGAVLGWARGLAGGLRLAGERVFC
jgi:tyrosyl-tRNA synthetase